ncbi:BrnT family toxin [Caenimonas aquaedulcis]|uniref:BrnT family toxin n=1 Tax=Caenimonas aquaedulcis TaxID=2793270 RepID=A0A931H704_9BURK|nr:BrnT family toxin [Caenimonas aquaedulcis]MBG9389841.1 BrnT family toxin [Caenimonas aquaedulcis]
MGIRFEWDAAKAASNLRKHGVSFELAMHVFGDPLAFSHQDRIEGGEQRWQTLGRVDGVLLLLVAHTVWDDEEGEVIRIISARQATRKEKRDYEQENGQA